MPGYGGNMAALGWVGLAGAAMEEHLMFGLGRYVDCRLICPLRNDRIDKSIDLKIRIYNINTTLKTNDSASLFNVESIQSLVL